LIVLDCNILSLFAKIDKLDLLKKLFPGKKFILPSAVHKELMDAKDAGYDFPDRVFSILNEEPEKVTDREWICLPVFSNKETKDFLNLKETKSLGEGELECISICKNRDVILLTNDDKAEKEASLQGVRSYNIEALLGLCIDLELLDKERLCDIINRIETKDRVKLRNKELLMKRFK